MHNEKIVEGVPCNVKHAYVGLTNFAGAPTRPCPIDFRYLTREENENYPEVLYIVHSEERNSDREKMRACECAGMRVTMKNDEKEKMEKKKLMKMLRCKKMIVTKTSS